MIERGRVLTESTRDSTLDREAGPSIQQLALFEAVYPDTNSEALAQLTAHDVDEALHNARWGNAGPARRTACEVAIVDSSRSSDQCPSGPGERLKEIRLNFDPDGVLKLSKATSTFAKHQGYNERFILYLYKKRPDLLDPGFAQAMDDVDADIDYSTVKAGHRKYKRHGNKNLEQRKIEYREKMLRLEIKDALGEPPKSKRPTINFAEFCRNLEIFLTYITDECRKQDGGLHKAVTYTGQRSSLGFLFRRYSVPPPPSFQATLKESMEGAKRLCSQAQQHGEGNVEDGNRPLTWSLYERFNEYFLIEGSVEGLFGKSFSTLCVNLAARGKSTAQVCTKHMKWNDDCMHIAFAHIKDAQDGSNAIKKLPRSLYCNPLTHSTCPVTAIFDYVVTNPDVISNPEESFFTGSLANQSQRFGRLVRRMCKNTSMRSRMSMVSMLKISVSTRGGNVLTQS